MQVSKKLSFMCPKLFKLQPYKVAETERSIV